LSCYCFITDKSDSEHERRSETKQHESEESLSNEQQNQDACNRSTTFFLGPPLTIYGRPVTEFSSLSNTHAHIQVNNNNNNNNNQPTKSEVPPSNRFPVDSPTSSESTPEREAPLRPHPNNDHSSESTNQPPDREVTTENNPFPERTSTPSPPLNNLTTTTPTPPTVTTSQLPATHLIQKSKSSSREHALQPDSRTHNFLSFKSLFICFISIQISDECKLVVVVISFPETKLDAVQHQEKEQRENELVSSESSQQPQNASVKNTAYISHSSESTPHYADSHMNKNTTSHASSSQHTGKHSLHLQSAHVQRTFKELTALSTKFQEKVSEYMEYLNEIVKHEDTSTNVGTEYSGHRLLSLKQRYPFIFFFFSVFIPFFYLF
jgi:hypothetical protein